jgi:hypothetical protein
MFSTAINEDDGTASIELASVAECFELISMSPSRA